ncbi:abortive infection family protein [Micromonospora echinaurantiaca]|uniref:abortive infection family protein n=1 Tax=Micromonospora echinaurantiaca TaxID=47857 RepID=UPI00371B1621
MTPDDLFETTITKNVFDDSPVVDSRLRTDLLDQLRRGPADAIDDLEVAEALALLLHSDFMAFGTSGGERLTDADARLALRALRATCARLGLAIEVPWQDFTSFRSYWLAHHGYGSWAARRQMVGEAFDPMLQRLYQMQEQVPAGTVVAPALNALTDPAVITEHLKRLAASVDTDPRLAVSVAKDLVESTAKLVLRERGVEYNPKDDLPALVAQSQQALRLHAAGVADTTEEAKALKTILGSLSRLTQGVTELRNQVGVGHGRDSVPGWVRPRHARLAAGAATTWCNLMLETLGDPEAPWRI